MAASAHFPKGWVPDMYLYNSDQTHYDLLVAENHRLALLGLVGSTAGKKAKAKSDLSQEDWKFVSNKKNKQDASSEELLIDANNDDYDEKDLEELDD